MGAGLAGLVATAELADAGKRVILLDQEPEASFGGQAWWSFGGLFLVDSPEQRRLRVHDSLELARQDWFGTAGFDRAEDHWPRQWAEAYLQFAAGEKRAWLKEQGIGFFPVVGWAERGGYTATGHGNSVPRFHIVWGTGPGVVAPFARRVARGRRRRAWSSCASGTGSPSWSSPAERSPACAGAVLEPSGVARGEASSRTEVGDVRDRRAGRRRHLRRASAATTTWCAGTGRPGWARRRSGCSPASRRTSTAACCEATEAAGASVVNRDRMWHYTEGIANHSPVWARHGIRILPGPSSLWLDATGTRLPVPLFPGFDTLGTLAHIGTTGHEHTWFVATQKIVEKEFALSGSEQNPDLTGKDVRLLLTRVKAGDRRRRCRRSSTGARTSSSPTTLPELVAGMNRITGGTPAAATWPTVEREVVARDREIAHPFTKDLQITAIRGARNYLGDKLIRVAPPHRHARPGGRAADRRPAQPAHPQDPRRAGDRPLRPGAAARRRGLPGPLRGRRGRRLRRRRHARLPVAGGHLPRRLPVLRAGGRAAPLAAAL